MRPGPNPNPTQGKEDEYNDWYNNVHLPEVLALPGFRSARRLRLSPQQLGAEDSPPSAHHYLALYELDISAEKAFEILLDEVNSGRMVLPDCIDTNKISTWGFDEIASVVEAPAAAAR